VCFEVVVRGALYGGDMDKPLSISEIRARAAAFARDWNALLVAEADQLGNFESRHDQNFVRELLGVFGQTDKRAALWQERAKRYDSKGTGTGRIDALIPGTAIIEVKSPGKNLANAEQQALSYLPSLPERDLPQFVLTTDFHYFRLLDRLAPDDANIIEFDLSELPNHADRLLPLAGYESEQTTQTQAEASIKASKLMGELYEAMHTANFSEGDASIFLIRVLFCLFADDAHMEGWPRGLFEKYIKTRTTESGDDVGPMLARLFQRLDKKPELRPTANVDELLGQFPYVNGDIFADKIDMPDFTKPMRDALLKCCAFDWSKISPAIFGSLFQTVKDKKARREMGEHYTTEKDIMRLIGPMFMDELNHRFDTQQGSAQGLRALRRDLGQMRFLDPACGCGNFLVVAYRELRALELKILERLQYLQATGAGGKTAATSFDLSLMFDESALEVKAQNFHGIELEPWPAPKSPAPHYTWPTTKPTSP
jgi:hypothetical protein